MKMKIHSISLHVHILYTDMFQNSYLCKRSSMKSPVINSSHKQLGVWHIQGSVFNIEFTACYLKGTRLHLQYQSFKISIPMPDITDSIAVPDI